MLNLRLPKQYYLGNLPGRLIFLYVSATTVFGFIGLVCNVSTWFMMATSYFGFSLSIWIFYIFLSIGIFAIMVLYWMFIVASQVTVANEQFAKHNNPVYDELLAQRADIQLIKDNLGIKEKNEII